MLYFLNFMKNVAFSWIFKDAAFNLKRRNFIGWDGERFLSVTLYDNTKMEGEFVVYCYTHQMMMERETWLLKSIQLKSPDRVGVNTFATLL